MPIARRTQTTMASNGIAKPTDNEATSLLHQESQTGLLTYEESLRLLPWQTDNEYVRSGYRRQLGSVRQCLWSTIACESGLQPRVQRSRLMQ